MKNNFQHTEILERINYAFVALDKNWCLTYTNKTATVLLNRNSDELIGKNIWELFPERIALPLHKAFLEAIETQQYIFLEEYYPPSNKWFENHIYPSPEGLSIYFRDITEKKKSEEKIIESELNYRSLFEQASDAIFITGTDFNFIDINTSGCKTAIKPNGTNILTIPSILRGSKKYLKNTAGDSKTPNKASVKYSCILTSILREFFTLIARKK